MIKKFLIGFFIFLLSLVGFDLAKPFRSQPIMVDKNQLADLIVVEKSKRLMTLYLNGQIIKSYYIALGTQPIGNKIKEGDGRTPEGEYTINFKNSKSRYHLSLKISYPSKEQQNIALSNGYSAGSDIMVHGIRNGLGLFGSKHVLFDWTNGCIAVTNNEIEEIWSYVVEGTIIRIVP